MTMIRHPAVYTAPPSRSLVPAAGSGIWYPLHDSSLASGIVDVPDAVRTLTGSPHANEWDTPLMITFPVTNGDAADMVAIQVTDDENDLYVDSQLSLVGMAVGDQFITAMQASYTASPGGNSFLWAYGKDNSTASMLGFYISSGEVPGFYHRAKGQTTTGVTDPLTASVSTFTTLKNQGTFNLVASIRPVSATEVDIELQASNGTQACTYTASAIDVLQAANSGTELPGVSGGITMANFVGLGIGGRNGASTFGNCWGRGTNTGRLGGFAARKFSTYSANRVTDTIASMLARPGEFPRTLCLDYS